MTVSVELREIRVFLTLCQELHYARTAERLHLAPSRISQIIITLERKVGGRLVDRTSRRVALTALGERFRDLVGAAHDQLVEAVDQVAITARSSRRPLRLNLFADSAVAQIPRIVKAYEDAYPDSVVIATEVPLDDVFGPLRRGEVDAVASWLPHGQPDVVTGPILSAEPRVLAVSTDHPLAPRHELSIEDVADYDVMRFDTMPAEFLEAWIPSMTPSGRSIRGRRWSERSLGDRGRMTSELVYLIATGRVVHPTVPSFSHMFGHPDIRYVPIVDLPRLQGALVWRRELSDPRVLDLAGIATEVVDLEVTTPR